MRKQDTEITYSKQEFLNDILRKYCCMLVPEMFHNEFLVLDQQVQSDSFWGRGNF